MIESNKEINALNQLEFSPEEDKFKVYRKKGVNNWIIAHILKGNNKLILILMVFLIIGRSIISSGSVVITGVAISEFISGNTTNLGYYILIILILGISIPLTQILNVYFREVLAQRIERDTRKEFYTSLLGKSQSFHDLQRIGDIMARTTNDVRMLNFLISPAISLIIIAAATLVTPIIYLILYYPIELILTPIIFDVLFLITLRSYSNKLAPITGSLRMEFGLMNANLTETLSGIEVVKGSTQEQFELKKYLLNAKNYRDAFIKQGYIQAKYLPILFLALAMSAGFTHSIILFLNGEINIGQIISYSGLLTQLSFPTYISIWVFIIVKLAKAGAERLIELMNQETEIMEPIDGITKKINGNIEFENVSFKYPNTEKLVLENISFELKAGQTVAIVGTTGSGKSTLTKLLSRLYDVTEGKILIDNIDIRDYTLKSLRTQISYIEQDIFLFSTSVLENISFGRVGSMEEVVKVSKQAQAHEFINSLPNGYESEVGERGVQLSGGEKQRIAIARSFLTDTPLLVLDDSTSAIDSDTE
ncbi:MAG: ABC transporter ATP-binding protein, partial [Promethearchaeota archaeon]